MIFINNKSLSESDLANPKEFRAFSFLPETAGQEQQEGEQEASDGDSPQACNGRECESIMLYNELRQITKLRSTKCCMAVC